jgi:hypothetical protein
MDFELKTLTRTLICSEKADALIVLIPEGLTAGDDALSQLAALAIKSGDLEVKPGKLLSAYRTPGIAATRVLLVGVGDASPKNIRIAVNAAMGALKPSVPFSASVRSMTSSPNPCVPPSWPAARPLTLTPQPNPNQFLPNCSA